MIWKYPLVYYIRTGDGCWVCGGEADRTLGIPVYEDMVLPNDWPGEWFGVDACRGCFARQLSLSSPLLYTELRSSRRYGVWAREYPE